MATQFSRTLGSVSRRARVALAAPATVAAVLFAALAVAAPAPKPVTRLVSVNPSGTGTGKVASFPPSVSSNGRFVAFTSAASDLVPSDTNGKLDVFVRDMVSGAVVLVSRNAAGTSPANGQSRAAAISANGLFVAFLSDAADLVTNDTNGVTDVFVRDLRKGVTTLVSQNVAGSGAGNGASGGGFVNALSISKNGRFVAFASAATDLVANDANGFDDVFVRDVVNAKTTLVSVNAGRTAGGNGASYTPSISANGHVVAFASDADDLVAAADGNGKRDVYLRNLTKKTTTLVSVRSGAAVSGDAASSGPSISANGRFVAFESDADDLVPQDVNGATDVFVRDLTKKSTELASVNAAGAKAANGNSDLPCVSKDGRVVAFASAATDIVAGDGNGNTDVFLRDLALRTTAFVSATVTGTSGGNGVSQAPSITPDGRFVVFRSDAADLVVGQPKAEEDVYLRKVR